MSADDGSDPDRTPEPKEHGSRFPRLWGAASFSLGAALVAFMVYENVVGMKAICFAPVLLMYGAWMMLVGEPIDKATGQPAGWAQVGAWLCGVLGIIVAVIITFLLQ
jgi:hypothetical protein